MLAWLVALLIAAPGAYITGAGAEAGPPTQVNPPAHANRNPCGPPLANSPHCHQFQRDQGGQRACITVKLTGINNGGRRCGPAVRQAQP